MKDLSYIPEAPALAGDVELLEVPKVGPGRQGAHLGHGSVAKRLVLQSVHVVVQLILLVGAGFVAEDAGLGSIEQTYRVRVIHLFGDEVLYSFVIKLRHKAHNYHAVRQAV